MRLRDPRLVRIYLRAKIERHPMRRLAVYFSVYITITNKFYRLDLGATFFTYFSRCGFSGIFSKLQSSARNRLPFALLVAALLRALRNQIVPPSVMTECDDRNAY